MLLITRRSQVQILPPQPNKNAQLASIASCAFFVWGQFGVIEVLGERICRARDVPCSIPPIFALLGAKHGSSTPTSRQMAHPLV